MSHMNWLIAFENFSLALCGSTALYLFSLSKGFTGAAPKLKQLFPGKQPVFYNRLDFIIVIVLGSVIGIVFFQPQTPTQALAAGFGWISAVNVLSQPSRKATNSARAETEVGNDRN
jgi:hypothetical protein